MLCKIYFPNSKLGLAYNILIVCYKSKDFSGTVAPFFCQLGKVRGTVAPFLRSERVKEYPWFRDKTHIQFPTYCMYLFMRSNNNIRSVWVKISHNNKVQYDDSRTYLYR